MVRDRGNCASTYLQRGIRILGEAIDRRLITNPDKLDDPLLRPLHPRDDFKKLRKRLESPGTAHTA